MFSERTVFIFPRSKGADRGNRVRLGLCSSRGQNRHCSLNKEKVPGRGKEGGELSCKVVSILFLEVFNRNGLRRLSSARLSAL